MLTADRVEIADWRRNCRVQRWAVWLVMGCFAGVAVRSAIPGIGLAVSIFCATAGFRVSERG